MAQMTLPLDEQEVEDATGYSPSPEEIARETAAIRATRTEQEWRKLNPPRCSIKTCRVSEDVR